MSDNDASHDTTEPTIEYNLGPQPLGAIMTERSLTATDLVNASTEHLTFKMVNRAAKGRRLTPNVKYKVRNALNKISTKQYTLEDLFNY